MKKNFLGKLATFFIQQFEMALLVILLILSIGLFGFYTLPKESLPEIVLPTITIQGLYPGASPEDVENLLVDPIENALASISNIDSITSDSRFGFAFITVNFIEGTDVDFKKLEIDNRINNITFSEGIVKVESSIFKTSEIPLMNISVSGETDIFTLTNIGEDLKEVLEQIPSIDRVNLYGGLEKEIHVVVNHIRMLEHGVTFNDIRNGLSNINVALPLGSLDLNGIHYNLKIDESLKNVDMIENVLIETSTGNRVFIRDFAEVLMSHEKITELNQTYVDGNIVPSIFLEVIRKADSDVLGTSRKIKELLESEKGQLYPENITISYSNDLSKSVQRDLKNIQESALSGLIVVLIVLFLFIGLKEAMVVSITIPLSLLATIGVLNFFNMTFNAFVVLGLIVALGLLVDNSIIVMENINRLRLSGYALVDAANEGTNQVALPILSATMTTLAAFFPLAILPGTLGDFVSTIPITIMITLVMSLIVSITITPTLSVKLLNKKFKQASFIDNHFMTHVIPISIVSLLAYYAFASDGKQIALGLSAMFLFGILTLIKSSNVHTFTEQSRWVKKYRHWMQKILISHWKKVIILLSGITVLLMSFAFFSVGLVKVSFFPQSEPDSLTIEVNAPAGITLEETTDIVAKIESLLTGIPDIDSFNTTIGGDELNKAFINVAFDKNKTQSGFALRNRVENEMSTIPGAEKYIQSISQGPPIGRPISIKIIGEDLDQSKWLAGQYKTLLRSIDGVYNVDISAKIGVPQLFIDVKARKAQTYGITVQSVASQIRGQVDGIQATSVEENRETINVMIMKSEKAITDKKEIENLYISTPKGVMLPVTSLATLHEIEGGSNIKHEDGDRVIYVEADLKENANITDTINHFNQMRQNIEIPLGTHVQIGGDIEGIQDSFIDLFQSMILAVFLVFIILTVQFKSIAQPFVILLTVPMAIIGVIWGLAITQNDFGFYAFMALVALVGIAVNDAIVLIDYTNYLRKEGEHLIESIVEASVTRLNPVLATTMTTICGVLPLAFKNVYYAQFSFSLVFGLLVTTILTLVFIPIIYSILENVKLKYHRINGGANDEK